MKSLNFLPRNFTSRGIQSARVRPVKHFIIREKNTNENKPLTNVSFQEGMITFAPDRPIRNEASRNPLSNRMHDLTKRRVYAKCVLTPLSLSLFSNETVATTELEKTGCFGKSIEKTNCHKSKDRLFRIRTHPRTLNPFRKCLHTAADKRTPMIII